MGLTVSRKTAKNLAVRRKNERILTVSRRKRGFVAILLPSARGLLAVNLALDYDFNTSCSRLLKIRLYQPC